MKVYEVMVQDCGTKAWYLNGKLHREGGPAIEYVSGTKMWYLNGKLHREDGPAAEGSGGTKEWWLNGHQATAQ
jgi:antitoxin component YwqK of YwqJK toxin-antitoxin module